MKHQRNFAGTAGRLCRVLMASGMLAVLLPAAATRADTIYLPRGPDEPPSCGNAGARRTGVPAEPGHGTACEDPTYPTMSTGTHRV